MVFSGVLFWHSLCVQGLGMVIPPCPVARRGNIIAAYGAGCTPGPVHSYEGVLGDVGFHCASIVRGTVNADVFARYVEVPGCLFYGLTLRDFQLRS